MVRLRSHGEDLKRGSEPLEFRSQHWNRGEGTVEGQRPKEVLLLRGLPLWVLRHWTPTSTWRRTWQAAIAAARWWMPESRESGEREAGAWGEG